MGVCGKERKVASSEKKGCKRSCKLLASIASRKREELKSKPVSDESGKEKVGSRREKRSRVRQCIRFYCAIRRKKGWNELKEREKQGMEKKRGLKCSRDKV